MEKNENWCYMHEFDVRYFVCKILKKFINLETKCTHNIYYCRMNEHQKHIRDDDDAIYLFKCARECCLQHSVKENADAFSVVRRSSVSTTQIEIEANFFWVEPIFLSTNMNNRAIPKWESLIFNRIEFGMQLTSNQKQ